MTVFGGTSDYFWINWGPGTPITFVTTPTITLDQHHILLHPELDKQRQRIVAALKSRLPPYWYDPVKKEWMIK